MTRLVYSAAILVCFASQAALGSINISLNPSNIVPGSTKVSFVTGAVDPSGGNSGFLGTIFTNAGVQLQQWETFCVETQEFVDLNGTKYLVHSTASNPTTAAGNMVSNAAKWIYYQFGHGGLTGWLADDGEEVQEAIWSQVTKPDNTALAIATGKAANWVTAASNALSPILNPNGYLAEKAKADRIRILNPITSMTNGVHKQSMLYEVPEASTIAVWSVLSLLGAGVAYRRNAKQLG